MGWEGGGGRWGEEVEGGDTRRILQRRACRWLRRGDVHGRRRVGVMGREGGQGGGGTHTRGGRGRDTHQGRDDAQGRGGEERKGGREVQGGQGAYVPCGTAHAVGCVVLMRTEGERRSGVRGWEWRPGEGREGGGKGKKGAHVPAAFTPSFWISPMPTIVSSTSMSCWPAEASEGRSACCCPPPMIACCA